MTLTVAYAPDERGKTALHLASMLARSLGDEASGLLGRSGAVGPRHGPD